LHTSSKCCILASIRLPVWFLVLTLLAWWSCSYSSSCVVTRKPVACNSSWKIFRLLWMCCINLHCDPWRSYVTKKEKKVAFFGALELPFTCQQENQWNFDHSNTVGTQKMAPHLKPPSWDSAHLQNQLCTYVEEILLETNFDLP